MQKLDSKANKSEVLMKNDLNDKFERYEKMLGD